MVLIKAATSLILLPLLFSVFAAGEITNLHRIFKSNKYGDGICHMIVETKGYRCEEHRVITEDGYTLSLQRIPMGRSGSGERRGAKPPVLLQHGLLGDASTWLSVSPDESLGFILADNGYDVWLANARGTNYSSGLASLNPIDEVFWDWSWDELVAYDLPAMFEYVYGQTGQKLHYVGHSLGTLMALAAFSRHEVSNMVRSAGLLCPIAYLGQMPSPLARAAAEIFLAEDSYWLGIMEFNLGGGPASNLIDDICARIDCSDLESVVTGPNCCINPSSHNHVPQPTSTKNMIHLSQMVREGTISMFDYGNVYDNIRHYGQVTPPPYNIANIPRDLPLFLIYGGRDLLSDVNDMQTLIGVLSEHDRDKLVLQYVEDYAHFDFVYGSNAREVVYNPLMAFFRLN